VEITPDRFTAGLTFPAAAGRSVSRSSRGVDSRFAGRLRSFKWRSRRATCLRKMRVWPRKVTVGVTFWLRGRRIASDALVVPCRAPLRTVE